METRRKETNLNVGLTDENSGWRENVPYFITNSAYPRKYLMLKYLRIDSSTEVFQGLKLPLSDQS